MDRMDVCEVTCSPEETQAVAASLIHLLMGKQGVRGTSTIVALRGDLGAGKTVFVKGAAKALGVTETVTSPTFVVERRYPLPEGVVWRNLVHIDAYRLENEDELYALGWERVATDPGNLIMIEWPGQVGFGVPERAVWVDIEHLDEGTRRIMIGTTSYGA